MKNGREYSRFGRCWGVWECFCGFEVVVVDVESELESSVGFYWKRLCCSETMRTTRVKKKSGFEKRVSIISKPTKNGQQK